MIIHDSANGVRKIRFVAYAVRWFDKPVGNTYCSVKIFNTETAQFIACEYEYGGGDYYRQKALKAMLDAGWIPADPYGIKHKSTGCDSTFMYERENGYPILWLVAEGTKKACIANGEV